jgi:hypothetical protein
MNTLPSLWKELADTATEAPQQGYLLRLMEVHAGCRIFAALQMPDRLKSIVLGVPKDSLVALKILPDSAAFSCVVAEIEGLGEDQAGIVLILNDGNYEDLFVLLTSDIIHAVAIESSPHKAVGTILRTIERWRRFLLRLGLGSLSDDEVQGLIGEFAVLARLIGNHGERTAVMSWTGPEGAIHDFAVGGVEIEVKSHQGNPAGGIWINDLSQLQPDSASLLYLVTPRVAPAAVEGLSLPEFVERMKRLLVTDDSTCELFLMKLASVGYLETLAGRYTRNYTVGELSAYRVSDGFPAIEPRVVPSAVEKVRYKLRLTPLEPWHVDVQTIIGAGSTPWGNP